MFSAAFSETNLQFLGARFSPNIVLRMNRLSREFEALRPFVTDGYIRIDGDRIFIYERGRPYLRLIAATFDEYLVRSGARHSAAV